jgi:FkbM family methyltransferase
VDRTLNLVGQPVSISAPDGDLYLQTMPLDGPFDLEQLFAVFCQPGGNVIDVGANIGITATIAGLMVAPGSVLALEPVAEAFAHLEANIERSNLRNVKCLNLAAAAAEGQVNLVYHPGHTFAAFVGYEKVTDRYTGYAEKSVRAVALDQLVLDEGLSNVDFVKIDVEGYELEVLRGSRAMLEKCRPVVFMEANHYCLNIFRRMSLVDFTEEVLSIFPVVYALDITFEFLDLTDTATHAGFFHESVVRGRFPNLLCGYDADIRVRLEQLAAGSRVTRDEPAVPAGPAGKPGPAVTPPRRSGLRRRIGNVFRAATARS